MTDAENERRTTDQSGMVDRPIQDANEDLLGWKDEAKAFADRLLRTDASAGLVAAVQGQWGSGKSSFINLARQTFEEQGATVIDFNPWLFSGTGDLVRSFFGELVTGLKKSKLPHPRKFRRTVIQYVNRLSPALRLIPGIGDTSSEIVKGLTNLPEEPLHSLKDSLKESLEKLTDPVVIVVDDIDRMTGSEIKDVFKLVRLTASLPHLIFLLAFDRDIIEQVLNDEGGGRELQRSGPSYLEKIVQISYDLPRIPKAQLHRLMVTWLTDELSQAGLIQPEDRGEPRLSPILDQLLNTVRDLKRFLIGAQAVLKSLGGQIELSDLILMEAVRVTKPELFTRLVGASYQLTHSAKQDSGQLLPTKPGEMEDPTAPKEKALFSSGKDDLTPFLAIDTLIWVEQNLLYNIINGLFPLGAEKIIGKDLLYRLSSPEELRRDHRLGHEEYLTLYLEHVAPDSLSVYRQAEMAADLMGDPEALRTYLEPIDPTRLQEVIRSIPDCRDKTQMFTAEQIIAGAPVLLNQIWPVPVEDSTFWCAAQLNCDYLNVGRSIQKILELLQNDKTADWKALATAVFDKLDTFSAQMLWISALKKCPRLEDGGILWDSGIRPPDADELEQRLVNEFEAHGSWDMSDEWALYDVYDLAMTRLGSASTPFGTDQVVVLGNFFHSAYSNPIQVFLTGEVSNRLEDYAHLVDLCGSEERLSQMIDLFCKDKPNDMLSSYLSYVREKLRNRSSAPTVLSVGQPPDDQPGDGEPLA